MSNSSKGDNKNTKRIIGPKIPELDIEPIISEVLSYHAEKGDIQTAATAAIILDTRLKMDKKIVFRWVMSYVEILQRVQQYNEACAIMKMSTKIFNFPPLNSSSTAIQVGCGRCKKGINAPYYHCIHCKKTTNTCSICHQIVRGIYVWCQGCSHGGHLAHMKEWFFNKEAPHGVCPVGCGHRCRFLVSNSGPSTF